VTANTFERIDRNNAALLIIDHQVGLIGIVRDYSVQEMYNNILLHATLGKTYGLPVVITTSTDQGNPLVYHPSDGAAS
jgi:nicotinamidase-related amidase